jgi:oligopeptide/dipeptide ABC transporter ATP-binding protein
MNAPVLLDVVGLHKRFPVKSSGKPALLHAVDDVNFRVHRGESVGLVGESGCGKSTLARLVARLIDPTEGAIVYVGDASNGRDIGGVPAKDFAKRPERAAIQMVFQDPTDSLNPRYTAFDTIAESLMLLGKNAADLKVRVNALAADVGLPPELLPRFPHQLSGGQKARVGIARALASQPSLLILDEPTSALDVSVQAVVLKLLHRLRAERGLSYLFVSHDLNVVRMVCDRVVVMYLGKIVETGPVEEVFRNPKHPYTQALVSAIPGSNGARIRLEGEISSPINPNLNACRFYGRCPRGQAQCGTAMPALREVGQGGILRQAACHLVD